MKSKPISGEPVPPLVRKFRCAIYTRASSEEGLGQEFNSLHAQRDAGEAFIISQRSQGWLLVADHYDDAGFSGGTLDRPALRRLLLDIEAQLPHFDGLDSRKAAEFCGSSQ
jgi:DNA invertase Pin-like site-specific DNA recombinase